MNSNQAVQTLRRPMPRLDNGNPSPLSARSGSRALCVSPSDVDDLVEEAFDRSGRLHVACVTAESLAIMTWPINDESNALLYAAYNASDIPQYRSQASRSFADERDDAPLGEESAMICIGLDGEQAYRMRFCALMTTARRMTSTMISGNRPRPEIVSPRSFRPRWNPCNVGLKGDTVMMPRRGGAPRLPESCAGIPPLCATLPAKMRGNVEARIRSDLHATYLKDANGLLRHGYLPLSSESGEFVQSRWRRAEHSELIPRLSTRSEGSYPPCTAL
ncbi:MAG: hypothetical protein JWR21_3573 [Herminiimonas sp.]|nr:hypothetical protein [Herminiimonas sp.]